MYVKDIRHDSPLFIRNYSYAGDLAKLEGSECEYRGDHELPKEEADQD